VSVSLEIQKMIDTIKQLIDRPIAFNPAFARLTGSINAALMLSQAFYWSQKTSDPDGWFWKTQNEWQVETCLQRYEQETARKRLVSLGILEEKKQGIPARLFFRVNMANIVALLTSTETETMTPERIIEVYSFSLIQMSRMAHARAIKMGRKAEKVDYADVLRKNGSTCHICQKTITRGPGKKPDCLQFDHVKALSEGGDHVFSNILPAHANCNSSKGANQGCNGVADLNDYGVTGKGETALHSLLTETTSENTTDIKNLLFDLGSNGSGNGRRSSVKKKKSEKPEPGRRFASVEEVVASLTDNPWEREKMPRIWDYYCQQTERSGSYIPTAERLKVGIERLRDLVNMYKGDQQKALKNYKTAIDNLASDEFLSGKNDRNKEYRDFDAHLCKNWPTFEKRLFPR